MAKTSNIDTHDIIHGAKKNGRREQWAHLHHWWQRVPHTGVHCSHWLRCFHSHKHIAFSFLIIPIFNVLMESKWIELANEKECRSETANEKEYRSESANEKEYSIESDNEKDVRSESANEEEVNIEVVYAYVENSGRLDQIMANIQTLYLSK